MMNRNVKLFIGVACVTLGLTSCSQDYFDQERYDQLVRDAFPVDNIDPSHTWKVFATATLDVAVNKSGTENYRVAVYKENPYAQSKLTVLAQGIVADGGTVKLSFSYEVALPRVYVALIASDGSRSVLIAKVTDGGTTPVDFFNERIGAQSRTTRSQEEPSVSHIFQPYDEEWVAEYLQTAKEPTQANTWDNYDNGYWQNGSPAVWYSWQGDASTLQYNAANFTGSEEDRTLFETYCRPYTTLKWGGGDWTTYFGCADEAAATQYLYEILSAAGKWSSWVNGQAPSNSTWVADETYVTNFKITGTYDGYINVAASEGIGDGGTLSGAERTVVVTGTWNITEDQRIGSLGKIIIANGGEVNVASGKKLSMVNKARLVVLPGGQLTGDGSVEVNNGNESGLENFNGGIVDVATFNNNFGKFYNYGEFKVNEYQGGAQESNFYNHHLASIDHFGGTGSTANARIFNDCQFYVKGNARIRNYEGEQGSSLLVDGELMCSSSEDGTTTPSYVGLAAGALVQAGSLYNNGTSWTGPTTGGYAVVKIGQISYLNWAQDTYPLAAGYFENNIYVDITNDSNIPDGNGYQAGETATAAWKFWNIVANGLDNGTDIRGNGHVTKVAPSDKASDEIIPASDYFVKGESGCTPGYKGTTLTPPDDHQVETTQGFRFCFEDNFPTPGDFDFNDVVLTLYPTVNGRTVTMAVTLDAVGATKTIGAALRFKDVQNSWVSSMSCTEDFDAGGNNLRQMVESTQTVNNVAVCTSNLGFTVRLFNDAHWALTHREQSSGEVEHYMLNTIKDNPEHTFPSRTVTFTFVLDTEEHANLFNLEENLDVFIVENHNSIAFEVHTVPFKLDQVLNNYANEAKMVPYAGATANYPWAICTPATFRYPIEFQSICGAKLAGVTSDINYADGEEPYPHFADWAKDHTNVAYANWYEQDVNTELVY